MYRERQKRRAFVVSSPRHSSADLFQQLELKCVVSLLRKQRPSPHYRTYQSHQPVQYNWQKRPRHPRHRPPRKYRASVPKSWGASIGNSNSRWFGRNLHTTRNCCGQRHNHKNPAEQSPPRPLANPAEIDRNSSGMPMCQGANWPGAGPASGIRRLKSAQHRRPDHPPAGSSRKPVSPGRTSSWNRFRPHEMWRPPHLFPGHGGQSARSPPPDRARLWDCPPDHQPRATQAFRRQGAALFSRNCCRRDCRPMRCGGSGHRGLLPAPPVHRQVSTCHRPPTAPFHRFPHRQWSCRRKIHSP